MKFPLLRVSFVARGGVERDIPTGLKTIPLTLLFFYTLVVHALLLQTLHFLNCGSHGLEDHFPKNKNSKKTGQEIFTGDVVR